MRNRSIDPRQWQIIRRLHAVGCPLEDDLRTGGPTHPLRVIQETSNLGTDLLPMSSGMGLVLKLRIVASVRITICRFDLQADWLKTPITWVDVCSQHSTNRSYCLHGTSRGDLKVKWEEGLNHRIGISLAASIYPGIPDGGVLKRFSEIRGFLIGTFPGTLPATTGRKLEATLYVTDLMGEEYPYSVVIENTQPKLEGPILE